MSKAPSNKTPAASASVLSKPRRLLFRLTALLVLPLILLVAAESMLRLVGFGYPTDFFLERQINGRPSLIDNQQFGKRFFPRGLFRYPHPQAMPAVKEPETLRVFVFGESAALGDPDPKFGLPRMLEILLQQRLPGRRIQVANVSMVAINSHVVLPIARECTRREGDLWVIYMGNNEMIGPFGALTVFSPQIAALPLIRANLAVKEFRAGQALDRALHWAGQRRQAPLEWGGMTMWGQQQVRHDDPRALRVQNHFNRNLTAMLEIARQAAVPVILCTVPTNLRDSAPFGSLHAPGFSATQRADWEAAYKQAIALAEQGNLAEAAVQYDRALALDAGFAELSFRAAHCQLALGQARQAAELFRRARDHDSLQFRTDSRLNQLIRERAREFAGAGVHLVDAEHLFASQSPHGVPGQEYFYEHVHLNPEGNYLLAKAVAERTAAVLNLETAQASPGTIPWEEQNAGTGARAAWSTAAECFQALGLTDWNRHDMLSRILVERVEQPPFTGQANHAQQVSALRQQIEALRAATKPAQLQRAARQVAQAVDLRPKDPDLRWNLAHLLDLASDVPKAEEQWGWVIRLLPHASLPCFNLARLFEAQQRFSDARHWYEQCLRVNPDHFEARFFLGVLLSRQQQHPEALRHLRQAVRQKPHAPDARMALGLALQQSGRTAGAEAEFREVLRLDPNHSPARKALEQGTR